MNRSDTRALMEHIYGDNVGYVCVFSLERLTGSESRSPREQFFAYPGEVEDTLLHIEGIERQKARDVYICAHLLQEKSRKRATLDDDFAVLALWSDVDEGRIPDDFPAPTALIESSPGRTQAYWRMSEPIPRDEVEALNKRIAVAIGGDPSGYDLSQLLRVPGTRNHKYDELPEVTLLHLNSDVAYDLAWFEQQLPLLPLATPKSGRKAPILPESEALSQEPPVPLYGIDLDLWHGKLPTLTTKGETDRSSTLFRIGCVLAERGATAEQIFAALVERDLALGLGKFVGRSDAPQRYWEMAERVSNQAGQQLVQATAVFEELMAPDTQLGRVAEILKSAAAMADIAALYESMPVEVEGMLLELSQRRGWKDAARKLRQGIKASLKRRQASVPTVAHDPTPLDLEEAPLPPNLLVPAGWLVDEGGVFRTGANGGQELVAAAAVVISHRFTYVDENREAVQLSWQRDGTWRNEVVDREVIANSRQLVSLSAKGFPVTSETAKHVVDFLAKFEATNMTSLPLTTVSNQLGWQGQHGSQGFLLGEEHLGGDPRITFRSSGGGEQQVADGLRTVGDIERWHHAVRPLAEHPLAAFMVYASLAAPLLEILDCSSFVVDLAGTTSVGKTTALQAAASVWGCPVLNDHSSIIQGWDATAIFLEQRASLFNGLPLLLDDTKRARPETVAKMVYDLSSGVGRGRGSITGTRTTSHWRTITLSTGESPITSFSQDGGTRARVLPLWGAPFGDTSPTTGATVRALSQGVSENYGHAGRLFVEFLLSNRDEWPTWKQTYKKLAARKQEAAGANSVQSRLAGLFAVVEMAAVLAEQSLGFAWDYETLLGHVWDVIAEESAEADRPLAALHPVWEWAASHQQRFAPAWNPHADMAECAGRIEPGEYIGFIRYRLSEVLATAGFDFEATRKAWRDQGWLKLDGEGKDYRARIGKGNTRLVAIKWEVVQEHFGDWCEV